MNWIFYVLIAVAAFVMMEGVAWFTHKYIMHGSLWFLHKDHHRHSPGFFEKNDCFFVIFAIPSWLLIMLGCMYKNWPVVSVGAGITLYGIAYFLVHDIIIHQRFKFFSRSNNVYIKSLRYAHKMHHKHLDKEDGECFGFLFINKKYRDKIRKDNALQQQNARSKVQPIAR